jgi:hypothetical protein
MSPAQEMCFYSKFAKNADADSASEFPAPPSLFAAFMDQTPRGENCAIFGLFPRIYEHRNFLNGSSLRMIANSLKCLDYEIKIGFAEANLGDVVLQLILLK